MLLNGAVQNCNAFELWGLWCWRKLLRVSWLQGDPTSLSSRKSVLNIHCKDWCWSWNSNTLATWFKEPTHWKDPDAGKESACKAGDLGLISGLGRSPREGKGYPLKYSGLENCMDCPRGRKESDTTEWLTVSVFSFMPRGCISLYFLNKTELQHWSVRVM